MGIEGSSSCRSGDLTTIGGTVLTVLSKFRSVQVREEPLTVGIGGGNGSLGVSRLSSKRGYAVTLFKSLTEEVTLTGPNGSIGPLRNSNIILVSRLSLRVRAS